MHSGSSTCHVDAYTSSNFAEAHRYSQTTLYAALPDQRWGQPLCPKISLQYYLNGFKSHCFQCPMHRNQQSKVGSLQEISQQEF